MEERQTGRQQTMSTNKEAWQLVTMYEPCLGLGSNNQFFFNHNNYEAIKKFELVY